MKILSVKITNIASIEGPCEINFEAEAFKNIGLFGITGPVGAGKSTIIDAICLALYNNTPRLDRNSKYVKIKYTNETINISNPSNLLRRGATSGEINLRFKGIDNKIWQSNWMIRRSRDKADGKLQSIVMSLFNETENEVYPESKISSVIEKNKELIGLDFKQFTKSVILAQGDFQAFLNASDDERAEILEKLTGSEIYSEISKEIYSKTAEVKKEYLEIETKINALQIISNEELEVLKTEINNLEKEVLSLTETDTNLKTNLKWYETLHEFNTSLQLKKQELITYEQEFTNLTSDFEKLKQIDDIAVIKDSFLETTKIKDQNQNLETFLVELDNELKILENNLKQTQLEIENSEKIKADTILKIKQNEPLYKKAREIDLDITRSKNLISEIEKEIQQSAENLYVEEKENSRINSEINTNNESIKNLNNWFTSNANVQNWAANKSLLSNQLQTLNTISIELDNLKHNYNSLKKSLESKITEKNNVTQKIIALKQKQKDLNEDVVKAKQKISNQDIDTFLRNQNYLNQQISAIKSYSSLAKNYKNLVEKNKSIQIEIAKAEKDVMLLTDVNEKAEIEIESFKTKINEQEIFVKKLELENSFNIQHLRSTLKPNTECPVCGSTTHKLEKFEVVNTILDEAQKYLTQLNIDFNNLSKNVAENVSKINFCKLNIENLNKQFSSIDNEISQIEIDWDLNEKLGIAVNLKQENVSEILHDYEKECIVKSKNLKTEIESFKNIQKEIELKDSDLKITSDALQKLETLNSELNLEIQNFESQQNQNTIDGKKFRKEEENSKNQISEILNLENWFDLYKNNNISFEKQIFNKIENWESYQKDLNIIQENNHNLSLKLSSSNTKIEQINLVLKDKKQKLKFENDIILNKINERKIYFNGEDVDFIENNLKTELEKITIICKDWNNNFIETSKNITTKVTVKQEKLHLKQSNEQQILVNNQKINQFLEDYNSENPNKLNYNLLIDLCAVSNNWILNIRSKQSEIAQKKSTIQGAIKMLNDQILNHNVKKPKYEVQEIKDLLVSNLNILNEKNENLTKSKGILMNQNTNESIKKTLLKQKEKLEPEYFEWEKISDLLGSADGKKLKKLAQQFTLDLLLQAANEQLRQINNRYILERIEDTLSILVVDQYMANTKRGTNSLSGGETFLVSLALSLALSTVSSTQLKVESLFIDEGFGNLDPNSLETAFLALENLQNQGRTIGIISHLDSVIDRLSLKVNVIPTGNGKSMVKIE